MNLSALSALPIAAVASLAVFPSSVAAPRAAKRAASEVKLLVTAGQNLVIDTNSATLQVLVDGTPTPMTFTGGIIIIDTLEVQANGRIFGQGPNALRFFLSTTAKIDGEINVSGFAAASVSTLLTASAFSEPGAHGQCGGGDGGTANEVITQSTIAGGDAFGSFQTVDAGGRGGESSLLFAGPGGTCFETEDHHPAGGGGGTLGTPGDPGAAGTGNVSFNVGACTSPAGVSAVDPNHGPLGGAPGTPVYLNGIAEDNFVGASLYRVGIASPGVGAASLVDNTQPFVAEDAGRYMALYKSVPGKTWEPPCANASDPAACPRSKVVLRRITQVQSPSIITFAPPLPSNIDPGDKWVIFGPGEWHDGEYGLKKFAGQGGGAGGNAIGSTTATDPNFGQKDRKGAPGGGGGGILEIYAYGKITISGKLLANGGDGARGENAIFLDAIGGGSGGGSGGLIRVQSKDSVELTTTAKLFARGGRAGSGMNDVIVDAAPPTNPNGLGHGGRGGKGIIQLHAPVDANGQFLVSIPTASLTPASLDPCPVIAYHEFVDNPVRQAAIWFGPH